MDFFIPFRAILTNTNSTHSKLILDIELLGMLSRTADQNGITDNIHHTRLSGFPLHMRFGITLKVQFTLRILQKLRYATS